MTGLAASSGTLLDLDRDAVAALRRARPSSLTLRLPTRERGTVELELFEHDIFAPDFQITASGGENTAKIDRGLHYRGIVKGDLASPAAVSVFGSEVIGTFLHRREDYDWETGRPSARSKATTSAQRHDRLCRIRAAGQEGRTGLRDGLAGQG